MKVDSSVTLLELRHHIHSQFKIPPSNQSIKILPQSSGDKQVGAWVVGGGDGGATREGTGDAVRRESKKRTLALPPNEGGGEEGDDGYTGGGGGSEGDRIKGGQTEGYYDSKIGAMIVAKRFTRVDSISSIGTSMIYSSSDDDDEEEAREGRGGEQVENSSSLVAPKNY